MLEGIRIEKLTSPHPEEWSNQWLNEPQDVENATFQRSDFQWYEEAPKGLFVGVFVDTAYSDKTWADESAVVPVGVGNYNNRYVFPYWHGKTRDPYILARAIINKCVPFYNDKNLRLLAIEEGAGYWALVPILAELAPWLHPVPIKIKNRSSDERIIGLAGLAKCGKLYLMKSMYELVEQALRWPRYTRDDILMATAMHLDWQPFSSQVPTHQPTPFPTNTERFRNKTKQDDARAEQRRHYG